MTAQHAAQTQSRLQLALAAAREAGALTLASFQRQDLKVDVKADRSVVTDADRGAERRLRAMIEATFPGDAIVGEEYGVKAGQSGWTWYLDPIDGTQAFVRGVPLFGTLIGLEYEGKSEVGVIFLPALGEMVYAWRGGGCWWVRDVRPEGKGFTSGEPPLRARVSGVASMEDAMFCTTWMKSFIDTGTVPIFTELCERTGVFRGWGDCYGYALVATGRAEIMVDPMLWVWDAAPLLICIEEAGGRYVSFAGKPDIHAGSGVATNALLHAPVMQIIQRGSAPHR